MTTIEKSISIHAPLQRILSYTFNPEKWSSWFVGLSDAETIGGDGDVGTVSRHHYLALGLQLPLSISVIERSQTPHTAHWKGKVEGSLTAEQRWDYTQKDGKIKVSVVLSYEMPGAVLGKVAERLIVERMQERALEQSLENLKLMSEAAAQEAHAY